MKANDEDRMQQLLQQALPRVEGDAEPGRDLWPAVLRHLNARPAPLSSFAWPLFDWALLAGLMAFAAVFPTSIPVFLYYL
jgi:hypothetical protein